MLSIYTSKKFIPKDKTFILDVESLTPLIKLKDDDFTRRVLKDIEKGKRQDDSTFIDRFGRGLYTSALSTGSKVLLLLHDENIDFVINGIEMGYNCWNLIPALDNGELYMPNKNFELQVVDKSRILVNNVLYVGDDISDVLEGAEYD